MATINLTINGKKVQADTSMTILQAVRANGIDDIPTLCNDERLEPFASCFLCVVKVEGRANFIPSCATYVADGMVITTDSPELREARKSCLELLLSNHYADCYAPCKLKCPSNVDIQGYIALVAEGEFKEAVKLIKETNPFVATCGRVCTRPCEDECRRNRVDERVGIDYLKRLASDEDEKSGKPFRAIPAKPTGKKAAIVGAGPAGLSCAYYLALKGHEVELFEEKENQGGMLRYGIPEYRLPKQVLDTEISRITELGVKINFGKSLGRDFTIDELRKRYDSVFIGIGCQANKPLGIEGEEGTEGFLSGIAFLERCERERACGMRLEGKVLVVGGGNTAIDCARTSLRLGAESVTLVYRRSRKEMPANPMEVDSAEHEGIKFHFLAAPKRAIADENKRLKAVEFIKMELGEPDASGRRRPIEVPGSEFQVECDWAFAAVGQEMDKSCIIGEPECSCVALDKKWGTFIADMETGATNIEGVFAGGDDVTGAATVIEAISAGKKSAFAMDKYMMGEGVQPMPKEFISKKDFFGKPEDEEFAEFPHIEKQKMRELELLERVKNFDEVELGFDKKQGMLEASRCLECGCASVFVCELKKYATEYDVAVERYKGDVGKKKVDDTHPFIRLDMNKCVLCGRCVRICSNEFVGANVYGFTKRGFDTVIKPALEKPLLETSCENCGMCVSVCPTGAIEAKGYTKKPGPWPLDYTKTICGYCSAGCELVVGKIGDALVHVDIPEDGVACFRGRFGASLIDGDKRIRLSRASGKRSTLKRAIEETTGKLKRCDMTRSAILVSPRLSNETIYSALEFARAIGTRNIGSITRIFDDPNHGLDRSTASYDDLKKADFILLIDGNIAHSHPSIGYRIVNAVYRGARLFTMSAFEGKFTRLSTEWLHTRRGSNSAVLGAILKAGIDEIKAGEIAGIPSRQIIALEKALRNANRPVIVYSAQGTMESCEGERALIGNIARGFGAKVLMARGFANTEALAQFIPNQRMLNEAIYKKNISCVISFGENPIGELPEYFEDIPILLCADIFETATTKKAQIIIPFASFMESDGSFIDAVGKRQELKPAFETITGRQNYEIIADLCRAFGKEISIPADFSLPQAEIAEPFPIRKEWFTLQRIARRAPSDSMEDYIKELIEKKGLWK